MTLQVAIQMDPIESININADSTFVLALEAVAENFEVKFAHAGDDDLTGFFVGLDEEGRIFF